MPAATMTALILMVLFRVGVASEAAFVESIFLRQAEIARTHKDASYTGHYSYRERDQGGSLLREETCTRRVHIKGAKQQVEFLRVTADSRVLEGRERERKIRELRGKGLVQDRTRMPFRLDTRAEYSYRVRGSTGHAFAGEESLAGRPVRVVEFEPVRHTGRHIIGRAWVFSDSVRDVGRMEFRPDRLPIVVPYMRMTLDYAPGEMMMLPERFELEMRVHVKFLVTLVDRYIGIEDRFGEYRFNTGLPDSLFD